MNLTLIVIRSKLIKESAEFYKMIGLKFNYHQHGNGPFHFSSNIGEITFEIYPLLKNQNEADTSLRLGFSVQNLDALILKLQQKNVTIVSQPAQSEFGYKSVIKDLEGRKIELTEI